MTDDVILKEVGGKLKRARKAQKISLRRLGELCGIDYGHISRLENGTQDVRILTLKRIADILRVELKSLFDK